MKIMITGIKEENMAIIYKFPEKPRHPSDIVLLDLLSRSLNLSNHFLSIALGRKSFNYNEEELDTVLDLVEANNALINEARRKS